MDIEKSDANEGNMALEAGLEVFWDEPADQDPANPMSWTNARKWTIIAMVSFSTFLT